MGYIEELRAIVGHRPLILTGAVCIIIDEAGRLLLQERKFPRGAWGIPGGLMELGESAEDTACREVYEETNLEISDLKLINVYSGPDHFIKAENGDEFYAVTVAYYTKTAKGAVKVDSNESLSLEYFHPENLPDNMVKSHKKIVQEFLSKHYSLI